MQLHQKKLCKILKMLRFSNEELENTDLGTFWLRAPENEKAAPWTVFKLMLIKKLMAESMGLEPVSNPPS